MLLKKNKLYKIRHHDVEIGREYGNVDKFTALTNCIIFMPCEDVEVDVHSRTSTIINALFLITFDFKVAYMTTTGFGHWDTFERLNMNDYFVVGEKLREFGYYYNKATNELTKKGEQ